MFSGYNPIIITLECVINLVILVEVAFGIMSMGVVATLTTHTQTGSATLHTHNSISCIRMCGSLTSRVG